MNIVYLGIDFHSTKIVIHRIERMLDGSIHRSNMSFYIEEFSAFIRTLHKNTYVCIEASTGVFEFYELIEPHVKQIIVIHPMGFRNMYLSGKKTDKIDAKKLADRLKVHIEDADPQDEFPSVWVPPKAVRELRELFSFLKLIKTQVTMQKNKMRAILRQHLHVLGKGIKLERMDVDSFDIPASARWMIKQVQEHLCLLLSTKKQTEERIKCVAIQYDESTVRLFAGFYGISLVGAGAILADAGCIERFKTAKKFTRYMRSAPRVDSSNETTRIGSIDKAGRKTSFGYLVEGLLNIYGGNPNYARFYYDKAKGKAKCKVRAAIVRKTLTAIFYMWKNKEEYRFKKDAPTLRKLKELEKIKGTIQAA